jgi:DNA-binding MarR family transcriptional regulator
MENQKIQELYVEALKLVTFFNRPENDKILLELNHIDLDFKLFPLFVAISKMQPVTVQTISNFSGKHHSTISRQIQRLEKGKLIETAVNPSDSRSHIVRLSIAGEKLSEQIKNARQKTMQEALADVTDEQQETIIDSLKLLNAILLKNTPDFKEIT